MYNLEITVHILRDINFYNSLNVQVPKWTKHNRQQVAQWLFLQVWSNSGQT